MANKVADVNQFTKKYGRKTAVSDLSFSVESGQVYGLLGPNGSGKTTTLSALLSLVRPTSGVVRLFEKDKPELVNDKIGVVLECASYYPELSAYRNLYITARIKRAPLNQIGSLLEKLELSEDWKTKVKKFSLGMKQRLAIAGALINNPDLLILDEPTNGLDPLGIAEIRNLIVELSREGKTILIASHLLAEMEKVCTHICILKGGRKIAEGPLASLLTKDQTLEAFFLNSTTDQMAGKL